MSDSAPVPYKTTPTLEVGKEDWGGVALMLGGVFAFGGILTIIFTGLSHLG